LWELFCSCIWWLLWAILWHHFFQNWLLWPFFLPALIAWHNHFVSSSATLYHNEVACGACKMIKNCSLQWHLWSGHNIMFMLLSNFHFRVLHNHAHSMWLTCYILESMAKLNAPHFIRKQVQALLLHLKHMVVLYKRVLSTTYLLQLFTTWVSLDSWYCLETTEVMTQYCQSYLYIIGLVKRQTWAFGLGKRNQRWCHQ